MNIYKKNPQYIQKLKKQYYNKYVKLRNYILGKKVWLNSIYIKTKQNYKLKTIFFKPFRVLYLIKK